MSTAITNAIRCGVDRIVAAITGSTAPDYTALLTAIKDSVANIDANTDDVEKLLDTINTTNTQIVTNTGETVTVLKEVLEQVTSINANTDEQEALLQAILDELKLHAKLVTNIGTACASVKDGEPELVTVLAWHTDQGDHLKSS